MDTPSLNKIDHLYKQNVLLHFVKFTNSTLAILSREISGLLRSLGDQKELSIWPDLILSLKKTRFELATLPILPVHTITDQLMDELKNALRLCRISFPDNLDQLSNIITLLEDFQTQDNQFLNWIQKTGAKEQHYKICLCPPHPKHVRLVEQLINCDTILSLKNLTVMSPRELKEFTFFDRILFCGSISLFSENQFRNFEYVWRSPRADSLYFLSYDWINDAFEAKPTFDIEPNSVPIRIREIRIDNTVPEGKPNGLINEEEKVDVRDIDFSPLELMPFNASAANGQHYYEVICESRLLTLDDGTVIYKEINNSSRIVEFNHSKIEIKKIKNRNLETGMPLIVRTEGSGDSIAAVADMLFGEKASVIRSKQDDWKIAFRKKLFTYSTASEVANVLTSLGAPTANEINVRNWQSNDTIKPKNENDFKAIMAFSGLADASDEYWENAKKINQMHIKAGRTISKYLLNRINDSSRTDLEKYGRIDIEIKGLAGKLSVIIIESVLPDIYQIQSGQLDKVLNIERKL